MIKRALQFVFLVLAVVAIPLACKGRYQRGGGSAETQTIAPAAAKPGDTGTAEMTQTIELADGRSEDEGVTDSNPAPKTGTAATTTGTKQRAVTGGGKKTAPSTATTRTQ